MELDEKLKKYSQIETCPVRNVISRFSGKWSVLVLCVLAENGTTRFGDLGRILPDVSAKVLASTLKGLEESHLIERRVYAEVPPRTEYSLTALGESLLPPLNSLIAWALENFNAVTGRKG